MAEREPVLAIGLMSGTSLDGVTGALVRLVEPMDGDIRVELLATRTVPYGEERSARIAAAIAKGGARELALLHRDVGAWCYECSEALCDDAGVAPAALAFVASHGQTVWHEPRCVSFQLGDPAILAERLGVSVVSDFRARDVAAGGEGAPLVPRADRILFAAADAPRVLLNLGGIANLSWVPPKGRDGPLIAFDTGPGVMVIDALVRELFPGRSFDEDGRIAATGRVDEALLAGLLADPWFASPPPRSTGREKFGEPFARALAARAPVGASPADLVATATALTARSIAMAARFLPGTPGDVVRSGGGARNPALVSAIASAWPGVAHRSFEELFFSGDAKEAVAFAFLGYLTWTGRPGNEPSATGAAGPRVLGSITPA